MTLSSGLEVRLLKRGMAVEVFGEGLDSTFPVGLVYCKNIPPDNMAIKRLKKVFRFTEAAVKRNDGTLTILTDKPVNDLEQMLVLVCQNEFTDREMDFLIGFFGGLTAIPHSFLGLVE